MEKIVFNFNKILQDIKNEPISDNVDCSVIKKIDKFIGFSFSNNVPYDINKSFFTEHIPPNSQNISVGQLLKEHINTLRPPTSHSHTPQNRGKYHYIDEFSSRILMRFS